MYVVVLLVYLLQIIPVSLETSDISTVKASVYVKNGNVDIKYGSMDKSATAYGYFKNGLLETGWSILEIKAGYGKKTSNKDLMYAAGYLEGQLTAKQIWQNYQNLHEVMLGSRSPGVVNKIKNFYKQQAVWTQNMLTKYGSGSSYWRHVSYVLSQFSGLFDGYHNIAQNQSDWSSDVFVVQMLNGIGDLLDLVKALSPNDRPDYSKMTHEEILQTINSKGHCSALIKVTGAYENIYMAHSSWFVYASTNRIYKHYDFNVNDDATALKKLSFSSYPGFLESLDDFYTLGNNMVLLQTTNEVPDGSMYKYVIPDSLFAWQRVRIATMMSSNGEQWFQNFKQYNSGTYNNQYMLIDLNKIHLGDVIDDGALWVVEQMPSLVVGGDQSAILRTGYWPSYNVPFYEAIYNKSGYPEFVAKYGTDLSYQLAPRAKIFRRDQGLVKDMKSFQHIMRYNDYENDPYSEGQPCNAICCRGDLSKKNPSPSGCYDTKVTDYNMAKKLQSIAINGPTLGENLKPFSWTGIFESTTHIGLPNTYNFSWVNMEPIL